MDMSYSDIQEAYDQLIWSSVERCSLTLARLYPVTYVF